MLNLPEQTFAERVYCLSLSRSKFQASSGPQSAFWPLDRGPARAKLDLLRLGKRTSHAVDQAQQESPQDTDDAHKKGFLRCANCQYPITHKTDRIAVNEKHQHVFANPHGYIYQIGCFVRAPGCIIIGEESSHFSWFPGYTWQIALCGRCLTLLGWAFRSNESLFFGLILDKLTENIVNRNV